MLEDRDCVKGKGGCEGIAAMAGKEEGQNKMVLKPGLLLPGNPGALKYSSLDGQCSWKPFVRFDAPRHCYLWSAVAICGAGGWRRFVLL
jgi:hypothetical protein